jgi:acetoin utilization protein AcuB
MPRVDDIMTTNPMTIPATRTIEEASQLMERLAMRHLPVVDEEGHLVGIVSDRDLRGPLPHGRRATGAPPSTIAIADVMATDVVTASPGDDLATIAQLMANGGIGAIPIVDAYRTPIGIISYVDVLLRLVHEDEADRCALERIDGY